VSNFLTAHQHFPYSQQDSGPTTQDRLIVLSAAEKLCHVATFDQWYMDGNFTMALKLLQHWDSLQSAVSTHF